MCTQTEPRSIDELLLLDTYQGMTDEEIDSIIEYQAQQKFYSLDHINKLAMEVERMNVSTAYHEAALQEIKSMVESMKDRAQVITPIREPEIFTPNITEVGNG